MMYGLTYASAKRSNIRSTDSCILFFLLAMTIMLKLWGKTLFAGCALVLCYSLILLFCDKSLAILSYVYLVFFAPLTYYGAMLPVSYCGILLAIFLLLQSTGKRMTSRTLVVFICVGIYCVRSYVSGDGLASLVFIFDTIIALNTRRRLLNPQDSEAEFTKRFFKFIYYASISSIACGIGEYVALPIRFSVPLGTDRACLVLIAGLAYPLLFINNKLKKTIMILFIITFVLLTISMTAILSLLAFCTSIVLYKLFSQSTVSSKQKVMIILAVIILLIASVYIWNFTTGINAIDNVIIRIKTILSDISQEKYDSATTGRYTILQLYLAYFNRFEPVNKLFGGGSTDYMGLAYYRNVSHNTYVDMLLYCGIIPSIILIFMFFSNLRKYRNMAEYPYIVALKVVYVTTALSISALTNSYWLIFMIL